MAKRESAEKAIKDIRRKTRRRFSAEEKIRIVMEGLRGEESISMVETKAGGSPARSAARAGAA
jgi:transposase